MEIAFVMSGNPQRYNYFDTTESSTSNVIYTHLWNWKDLKIATIETNQLLA